MKYRWQEEDHRFESLIVYQKTYTVDFLSKKRVVNNGIVPQYYVENSHEAIIPRELFMQVQKEMVRRVNLHPGKNVTRRGYSSKNALSGIVLCGECGETYRRVHWNNRGCRSIVWRCVSRLEEKGSDCNSPTINEETLKKGVVKAINLIIDDKDNLLETFKKNIETVVGEELDQNTYEIDAKIEELQNKLLQLANSQASYDSVVSEIYCLQHLKQKTLSNNADRQSKCQRINEMIVFLDGQSGEVLEFDDTLVRKLIEHITVNDNRLVVEFKTGVPR